MAKAKFFHDDYSTPFPEWRTAERVALEERKAARRAAKKSPEWQRARAAQKIQKAESNINQPDVEPDIVKVIWSQRYLRWSQACTAFFEDKTETVEFPRLEKELGKHGCRETDCVKGESLGICHHELEKTLRCNEEFGEAWLKKERLRWHPDRFSVRKTGAGMAQEMFQLIQRLIDGK